MPTQVNKIFDYFLALEGPRLQVARRRCVQQVRLGDRNIGFNRYITQAASQRQQIVISASLRLYTLLAHLIIVL